MKVILFFLTGAAMLLFCMGCDLNIKDRIADQVHERVLTVDAHVDTPLLMNYVDGFDPGERHDYEKDHSQVDFPRMQDGGLDAVFFAVFTSQGPRTPAGNAQALDTARNLLRAIDDSMSVNAAVVKLALTPRDAYRLEGEGRRAVFIGLENGYPLGDDLSLLREFYDRGVRYITLSHAANNDICDSSTDSQGPEHGGLSDFGRQVVSEMNRLGILVDVSHVSDDAFFDVLAVSSAPIIASHSCTRALYDHPRNLSDEMLVALAANDGVVCIALMYVAAQDPTVAGVVDHIDHSVRVAGIDHVGIGSDFDGGGGVSGCRDVSEVVAITRELVQRGYSEEAIAKIWGGNIMRAMQAVIDAAQ